MIDFIELTLVTNNIYRKRTFLYDKSNIGPTFINILLLCLIAYCCACFQGIEYTSI